MGAGSAGLSLLPITAQSPESEAAESRGRPGSEKSKEVVSEARSGAKGSWAARWSARPPQGH